MAHHKSAKKCIRRDAQRKVMNHARMHRIRTFVRKAEEVIAGGKSDEARLALQKAQSELMQGVSKGLIHRNTASRKISRLAGRVSAL